MMSQVNTVKLILFDDAFSANIEDLLGKLQQKIEDPYFDPDNNLDLTSLYKKNKGDNNHYKYTFRWHEYWHGLGEDERKGVYESGIRINNNETFESALKWCLDNGERSICYFDFGLMGVGVTPEQVKRVGKLAIDIAKTALKNENEKFTSVDAAEFYNNNHNQGLLLAAALAMNKKSNSDIWLATSRLSSADTKRYHTKLKQELSGTNRLVDIFNGSLSGRTNQGKAAMAGIAGDLMDGIKKYVAMRMGSDSLASVFWPNDRHAEDWFNGSFISQECPPHDHTKYKNLPEDSPARKSLEEYLQSLGLDDDIAKQWLESEKCYETLKRFVGGSACTHRGTGALTLSTLLFPLLKAVGPSTWVESFNWNPEDHKVPCHTKISMPDHDKSQALIHAVYTVFKRLSTPNLDNEQQHDVKVKFVEKVGQESPEKHLMVDFDFDCSVASKASDPSMIVNTQAMFLDDPFRAGNTLTAWKELLKCTGEKQEDRQLFIAVYPYFRDERNWTRLDFGAKAWK